MTASASAPGSSANLGPGFDFLALALELRCWVTAAPSDKWSVPMEASAIAAQVTTALGAEGPYEITIESDIPVGRGLGSSAALAVATGAAALLSRGIEPDNGALFRAAAAVDGHPDNAAASVYGGLVAVAAGAPHRLELAPSLVPIIVVPNATLSTAEARAALPKTVPHAAAARSVARAAFLVEGLRTADPAALAAAADDELHEGPRASLSPQTVALMAAARTAGALHAAWSGAGPSVIALAERHSAEAVEAALRDAMADDGMVLQPGVAATGVSWS